MGNVSEIPQSMGYNVEEEPEPDQADSESPFLGPPILDEVAVFLAEALAVFVVLSAVVFVPWGWQTNTESKARERRRNHFTISILRRSIDIATARITTNPRTIS